MKKSPPPRLRVLVCSANLGNAEPDVKSLEAWIPDDGSCSQVLEKNVNDNDNREQYPVIFETDIDDGEKKKKAKDDNNNNDSINKEGHYDLIVLGLQESTFVPTGTHQELIDLVEHLKDIKENNEDEEELVRDLDTSASHTEDSTRSSLDNTSHSNKSGGGKTQKAAKARELLANSTSVLHQKLQTRLPSYKRLVSFQRGEMRLLVFVTSRSSPQQQPAMTFQVESVKAQNTGKAGLPNKGGIVAQIQVQLNNNTPGTSTTTLAFTTCHLEAHEGVNKYKTRCSSLGTILNGTTSPSYYPDVSLSSHYCFVLGDLNFRTRYQGHIHVEDQLDQVQALILAKDWQALNEADELGKAVRNHECLYGFQTPLCYFPPTFKVEKGVEGFAYQKKRTPSYTDRILWRTGHLLENNLKVLCYEPIDQFTSSDHKPIRASFEIDLNDSNGGDEQKSYPLSGDYHLSRYLPSWLFSHPPGDPVESGSADEKLHVYVSDMQCDIFPGSANNNKQGEGASDLDSYIRLVSSPANLLLPSMKSSSWKDLLKCKGTAVAAAANTICGDSQHHGQDEELARWPHSHVEKNTLNPEWGDEEIHCSIHPGNYGKDGHTGTFGGAMLYIMATKDGGDVIGTFPVNLEYLFRLCHDEDKAFNKQIEKLLGDKEDSHITVHPCADGSKMVSWEINGPLLRNGLQTGVLRCSLDAWWTRDGIANAAKGKAMQMGLASNDSQIISTMDAGKLKPKRTWWRFGH